MLEKDVAGKLAFGREDQGKHFAKIYEKDTRRLYAVASTLISARSYSVAAEEDGAVGFAARDVHGFGPLPGQPGSEGAKLLIWRCRLLLCLGPNMFGTSEQFIFLGQSRRKPTFDVQRPTFFRVLLFNLRSMCLTPQVAKLELLGDAARWLLGGGYALVARRWLRAGCSAVATRWLLGETGWTYSGQDFLARFWQANLRFRARFWQGFWQAVPKVPFLENVSRKSLFLTPRRGHPPELTGAYRSLPELTGAYRSLPEPPEACPGLVWALARGRPRRQKMELKNACGRAGTLRGSLAWASAAFRAAR